MFRSKSWKLRSALVALVVSLVALLAPSPVSADDAIPVERTASAGARWLASKVGAGGYVDSGGVPDVGATLDIAVALAAAGVEQEALHNIIAFVSSDVETVISAMAGDNPGRIGQLLVVLGSLGVDPTNFGEVDLVARLDVTLGASEPGLYGAASPMFDGVYRQSLALLGLHAVGVTPPQAAAVWLVDQQCSAPVSAAGGWEAHRADTAEPCNAPDPSLFTGPDSNQTAMAVAASAALELGESVIGGGLDFLEASQAESGGFAYRPGGDDDPNSTALGIVALISAGEQVDDERWAPQGGPGPLDALLAWQLDCSSDTPGAFASPWSGGGADLFASRQAVWGAALTGLPLDAPSFGPTPLPCAPFVDVTLDHPFVDEIAWMADSGIASGFVDGTFRPTESVSRQAMAAFLARSQGAGPLEGCVDAPFVDVAVDHPFCAEIAWLVDHGIAQGYVDGTFRPTAPVSRQATATFLARFDALSSDVQPPVCTGAPFVDVAVDHPFCAEIAWLVDHDIAQGYVDGTFRPTAPVSRQATAAFLQRLSLI